MMFIEVNQINNTTAFDPKSHSFSFEIDGNFYLKINNENANKSNFYINKIISKKKYTYVWMDKIASCDIYHNFRLLKRIPDTYLLRTDDNIALDKSYVDFNTFETFYNFIDPISEDIILANYVPYQLYLANELVFAYNNFKGEIKKIDRKNNSIWNLKLSDLGNAPFEDIPDEIEKILGIAHGNVWFNTKGGRLVALDVESGEVIRKFSCYKNDQKLGYDINLKIGRNTYINDFDNHIYGMSGNYFQKINAETLEIEEEFNYFDSPDGIGKFKNHYSFLLQGNYFTFIAQKDDGIGGIRFAGLFDYRKKELVWEYEIISAEEKKAGNELIAPQPLYMSGNRLYIKDFKNTLHIFEKESE